VVESGIKHHQQKKQQKTTNKPKEYANKNKTEITGGDIA